MSRMLCHAFFAPALLLLTFSSIAQEPEKKGDQPDDSRAKFEHTLKKMSAEKQAIVQAARAHLADRYDLGDRPAACVTISRVKAVQEDTRVRMQAGVTS